MIRTIIVLTQSTMNQTTARPPNFRGRVRVRSGVWSIALVLNLSSDTRWRGNVSRSRPWSLVDVVAEISDSKGPNRPSSWRSPYMCVHFVIDATTTESDNMFHSGEYRIYQAQHPADSANNPATLRQGSSLEPSTQPGFAAGASTSDAGQAVPYAPQTKSGLSAPNAGASPGPEPTPQRTNGDGRVYTKAPTYFDSYKEKTDK